MTRAFELNPDLNARDYAGAYARDGVVRISNILKPDSAEAIARVLEAQTPWRLTISDEDNPKPGLYDAARIQTMGREALGAQIAAAIARARQDFAYLYLSYPMIRAYIEGWDPGHPIHAVAELINSQGFLDVFRQVTRRQDILKADAQATSYRPGDFLTLHDDDRGGGGSEGRIAAYTFGFTRIWRPDWGGQLLFHGEDGEIERGLTPAFNTLTVFKVPRQHSVAVVAPYAGSPRLSIVGWARNDPPKPNPT